jgi:hypothetical protein
VTFIHSKSGFLIFLLSVAMLLGSCLPEQKIANTFIRSREMISLMVTPPEMVYKFNHKGESIEGFDSLTSAQKDSALWYSSTYMKHLSDSIILEKFMNNFLEELRLLGFKVYLNSSADSFPANGPQSYLLNISQVQFDEYTYPLEDEGEFFDSIYVRKIDLGAVDFSCWFDLKKAGSETARTTVLYGTHTAYDAFEGHFFADPFSGKIRYKYAIDELEVNDLYDLSEMLGKKYAGYLYDFYLNQYIARNLPKGEEMVDYFHYSRKRNMIMSAYEERFQVLGTK